MLSWRVGLSVIIVPALIALFYFDAQAGPSAPILLALTLVLGLRCTREMVLLLRPRFPEVRTRACGACVTAVLLAGWAPHWWGDGDAAGSALAGIAVSFVLCVIGLFALEAWRYHGAGRRMETLAGQIMTVAYVGLLLAVTAQLRWVAGAAAGYLALGSLIIAVKMGDTTAYTCGRLFGKRKMAPTLSPGKTWAGFSGALLGSAVAAWAWLAFATPVFRPGAEPPTWYWSLLYGGMLGLAGLVGDLCESLIKRDMGRKDAAPLMPGFGGLLDLLDSVLYAGPVALVLWKLLPLATW